jgi:hypothetical protein
MIAYTVSLINRKQAESIITKWHYSKGINGVIADICFGLWDKDILIGAMIFGRMAMAGQYKKYVEKQEDLLELRRLACIDNTPRNTESFFIGHALRYLKKNTKVKVIISYADSNYGHSGIIYKASNFQYLGLTSCGRVIIYKGKKYHDKAIRTKYKGILKPFAKVLVQALKVGEAVYKKQLPKHIYRYDFK